MSLRDMLIKLSEERPAEYAALWRHCEEAANDPDYDIVASVECPPIPLSDLPRPKFGF